MHTGYIKVRLTFQSPLGAMVKRKQILVFSRDICLREVADVVSGVTGTKPLWPSSFGACLDQSGSPLLMCYWNHSEWEPLPSFSTLKDIKSDHSNDDPVELLFCVLNGQCLGFKKRLPDVTLLTQRPPLIPKKARAQAKVSASVVSTKESTGSEGQLIRCQGVISL